MRRRTAILFLAAALLLLPLPCRAEGDEGAPAAEPVTEISDAAGMWAIAENPGGSYRLAADIDMGGSDWAPLSFCGKLDGQGHTLYNLRVRAPGAETAGARDGNRKLYDTQFAGLFSILRNAEVKDLTLRDVDVRVDAPSHCFAAALAGYMESAVVTGCAVSGRVYLYSHGVMVGVGGLCGYGSGEIVGCTAQVELLFADRSEEALRCEEFMGGVLACGIANIDGCTVQIDGYASCHGYVHNGGLVGMYYHCGTEYPGEYVRNCTTTGRIRFFENNPDRRAYCKGDVGEALTRPFRSGNHFEDFVRDETKDYSAELAPESCAAPVYTDTLTPPDCADSWGYTTHRCTLCGYHWNDSYTRPGHEEGAWERISAADYGQEGLEQCRCTRCGELLGERREAALIPAALCRLDRENAQLAWGETLALTARVTPQDVSRPGVVWRSSDPGVAQVDESGLVTARRAGSATITCTSADGFVHADCVVTVRLTLGQWVSRYLFFGWAKG